MATQIITSADTGKTIALHNSANDVLLTSNATSQTVVRLVNVTVATDAGIRRIQADTDVKIRGWIPNVDVTEIVLHVDGQLVQLMFDAPNLTWYVISKYVPAEMLSPLLT